MATWLAIYPTITLVLPGLEAVGVNELALPLRTLAISAVVVPAVVFVVTPALTKLLGPWLHGSSSREPGSRKPGATRAATNILALEATSPTSEQSCGARAGSPNSGPP